MIKRELLPVSERWLNIGIALRLKISILDHIQARNIGDPSACLTSMVTHWLERKYNVVRFGKPTWQRLVEAVAHRAGGANIALAREIARRHKAEGMPNRYICCTVGKISHFVKQTHSIVLRPRIYYQPSNHGRAWVSPTLVSWIVIFHKIIIIIIIIITCCMSFRMFLTL